MYNDFHHYTHNIFFPRLVPLPGKRLRQQGGFFILPLCAQHIGEVALSRRDYILTALTAPSAPRICTYYGPSVSSHKIFPTGTMLPPKNTTGAPIGAPVKRYTHMLFSAHQPTRLHRIVLSHYIGKQLFVTHTAIDNKRL